MYEIICNQSFIRLKTLKFFIEVFSTQNNCQVYVWRNAQQNSTDALGPYSETWYKAIPAVLLGSISRENPKVSVLRLFRIQR